MTDMKVLLLNTTDIQGGAARAAFRLQQGFQKIGVSSQFLVEKKLSEDSTVITSKNKIEQEIAKFSHSLDRLPLQIYPRRTREVYSLEWFPDRIAKRVAQLAPDIINLHWIFAGYVQIETIAKFNKPIVWTLHDMWVFTGGCHYSSDCDRYTNSCGTCPQLKSDKDWDLSRWVWQRKAKAWRDLNLTVVTPSSWLANCAKASSLLKNVRVEVIPNGLDTEKYRPIDRHTARKLLNLPENKKLVLFGAVRATRHKRKGFELLQAALQELSKSGWQDKLELVVFGASKPENPLDLGFNTHYLGQLHDDISLALIYSAADVTVIPSIQEAFGQTASESLACGTPAVAFNGTGVTDIVDHEENGYLAKQGDIGDLARGISWVLENDSRHQKLGDRAREKAENYFTLDLVAHRYLSIFNEMMDNSKHGHLS